jgi:hypothetical protein
MNKIKKSIKKYIVELLLFFLLLITYVYFFPRWADWGQNARLDFVLSIVDKGTFSIDEYYQNTGDYAFFEGHYYMDKAPGVALLGVPVYWVTRPMLHLPQVQGYILHLANNPAFSATLKEGGSGLLQDKIYNALVLYILTFFISSVPSALLGVLIYRLLCHFELKHLWSAIVVLIWGLTTNVFPYANAFLSHQLTAFLLFGAFYIAIRIRDKLSPYWAILVGFSLGWAIISEYPVVLIAVGIFVYTILILVKRGLYRPVIGLVLGGIPPGLVLVVYDLALFHTILPVGYKYSALFSEQIGSGFLGLTYPNVNALWGVTFGNFRGLFFISPVLLLAVVGLWLWYQRKMYRMEMILCAWAFISFLVINSSSNMWQGGFSIGPRYMVPMLPFLAMGFYGFAQWGDRLWARILLGFLFFCSGLVVWIETTGGQSFPDWTDNPLINYSAPHFFSGDIARNLAMVLNLKGLYSLIPLGVVLMVGIYLIIKISNAKNVSQN